MCLYKLTFFSKKDALIKLDLAAISIIIEKYHKTVGVQHEMVSLITI